jgi:hypothetical protein
MVNARGIARLGMLAVALGVGAAVAHSPVASADSASEWLSSIDSLLGGSALPAPSSGLDLAISYDGYALVQEGNAIAHTTTGEYGLAIADGSGAYAYAGGGTGDVAEAEGTNAFALAGGDPGDTGGDYDTAIDIGNNDLPSTAADDGAYAGNGDLGGGTGTGAYDTAIDIGNNTNDLTEGIGGNDGAFAGAGGLVGDTGDGNHNTAIDVGNNSGEGDGADAFGGNGNYASESGSMTGYSEGAYAGLGNDNTAVADTSYNDAYGVLYGGVYAVNGNDNSAFVLGPENSVAVAYLGDSNSSYVFDPFGSTASVVSSGYGFSSDMAANLFNAGTTAAVTGNDVYDILTASGPEAGTF